ncbi:hypothetical protein B0T24DRAFT_587019 [Lasiosphaeria ovina]|uniref:Uncharacterized protein n=1 Tax=Lasiosphaeria ovina TaxID=92902 RepID=A0AAE0NIP7_9PEZI|nr:hypothetical protein B0T24DRAFT_587019 [Lasiosphaeria ovina]
MVQDSDTPVEAELAALQPPRTKDTDKLALTAGRDFASGTRLLHSVLENEMNYPSLDNFDVSIGKVPAVDAPGAAPEPVVPVDLASGTQAAQRLDLITNSQGTALKHSVVDKVNQVGSAKYYVSIQQVPRAEAREYFQRKSRGRLPRMPQKKIATRATDYSEAAPKAPMVPVALAANPPPGGPLPDVSCGYCGIRGHDVEMCTEI